MKARRFLTQFNCLAGDCPDTCCGHWRIGVDEDHLAQIRTALDGNDEDRAKAAVAFEPTIFGRSLLAFREDGYCHFLDEKKLCTLHSRFGEQILGNACSMFPRFAVEVEGGREAAAELSCPEAARLLVAGDDAMDLVDADPTVAGRGVPREGAQAAGDARYQVMPRVRDAMDAILQRREFPVDTRLFFAAYFASRVDTQFAPDTASVARERATVEQPAVLQKLEASFRDAVARTAPVAPTLIFILMSARLRSAPPPGFMRMVSAIVAAEIGEASTGDALEDVAKLGAEKLATAHAARAKLWHGHRVLERALENYARHFVAFDWVTRAPTSMLGWALDLLVRVAAVRWLALGHPSLRGLTPSSPQADQALEKALVDGIYNFGRAIDHNRALVDSIGQALAQTKMTTLAHAVSLLQF